MGAALVETAALTLLHFLWEGLLIGGLAAVALAVSHRASTRHLICILALTACLAGVVITALVVAPHPGVSGALSGLTLSAARPVARLLAHAPAPGLPDGMHLAVMLWLTGVLCVSGYYALQWRSVARVRRGAAPMTAPSVLVEAAQAVLGRFRASAQVVVLSSQETLSPIVVGLWRPVIIFPAALLARMPTRDFELILLHEVAHIVRRDAWANALSISLTILLFYHPVVHWLSRRARLERECACDDFAVEASGSAYAYAQALTSLSFPSVSALTLGAAGGELLTRLRHLAGDPPPSTAAGRVPALLLFAATLAALLLLSPPEPAGGAHRAHAHGRPQVRVAEPVEEPARVRVDAPRPSALRPVPRVAPAAAIIPSRLEAVAPSSDSRLAAAPPPRRAPVMTLPEEPRHAQATSAGTPPAAAVTAAPDTPAQVLPPTMGADVTAQVPEPVYDPAPEYPIQARLAGIQGSVQVIVRIDADGRLAGLSILKATPQGVFEGAVRRALTRWRYRVADGAAHAMRLELDFTLAGVSSQAATLCATATASRTCEAP